MNPTCALTPFLPSIDNSPPRTVEELPNRIGFHSSDGDRFVWPAPRNGRLLPIAEILPTVLLRYDLIPDDAAGANALKNS